MAGGGWRVLIISAADRGPEPLKIFCDIIWLADVVKTAPTWSGSYGVDILPVRGVLRVAGCGLG